MPLTADKRTEEPSRATADGVRMTNDSFRDQYAEELNGLEEAAASRR
jgi:hypothetical protein